MEKHGNTKKPDYSGNPDVLKVYRDYKSKNSHFKLWYVNLKCPSCGDTHSRQDTKFKKSKNAKCKECTKKKDMSGKSFGLLKVLDDSYVKDSTRFWLCRCECGTKKYFRARSLPASKSCGCLKYQGHGTHNKSHSKEYIVWGSMIGRATNENSSRAKDYVGRGIGVSREWLKFENFLRDMGKCPTGMTLERINNNQGYCKENCKWETRFRQQSNRRVKRNKTGRIGVSLCKQTGKYKARIKVDGKYLWLGRFESFEKACEAVDETEIRFLGYSRKEGFIKDD